MHEWQQLIQTVVNEMDGAIVRRNDQALTLRALAARQDPSLRPLYLWIRRKRLCAWNYPRIESYGVRLSADYSGPVPAPLELMDVPEGEYVVFEHGPFDYEQECRTVEDKVEAAMRSFDYAAHGCTLDTATPGRVTYFYFVPGQYFKYIRPIRR